MVENTLKPRIFPLKNFRYIVLMIFVASCNEAPVIQSQGMGRLNSPSSMIKLTGTDCAIVTNANVNLDQKQVHLSLLIFPVKPY